MEDPGRKISPIEQKSRWETRMKQVKKMLAPTATKWLTEGFLWKSYDDRMDARSMERQNFRRTFQDNMRDSGIEESPTENTGVVHRQYADREKLVTKRT